MGNKTTEKMSERKIKKDFLNGTWVGTKSENMDKILQKMGYSWPVRKIAGAMSVTLVITDENTDGIITEFKTVLKSTKMELSFDHEVYDTGLTSSEKYTIGPITIAENEMKHKTHLDSGSISLDIFNTYHVNGNELKLTQVADDLTAFRLFEKKE